MAPVGPTKALAHAPVAPASIDRGRRAFARACEVSYAWRATIGGGRVGAGPDLNSRAGIAQGPIGPATVDWLADAAIDHLTTVVHLRAAFVAAGRLVVRPATGAVRYADIVAAAAIAQVAIELAWDADVRLASSRPAFDGLAIGVAATVALQDVAGAADLLVELIGFAGTAAVEPGVKADVAATKTAVAFAVAATVAREYLVVATDLTGESIGGAVAAPFGFGVEAGVIAAGTVTALFVGAALAGDDPVIATDGDLRIVGISGATLLALDLEAHATAAAERATGVFATGLVRAASVRAADEAGFAGAVVATVAVEDRVVAANLVVLVDADAVAAAVIAFQRASVGARFADQAGILAIAVGAAGICYGQIDTGIGIRAPTTAGGVAGTAEIGAGAAAGTVVAGRAAEAVAIRAAGADRFATAIDCAASIAGRAAFCSARSRADVVAG